MRAAVILCLCQLRLLAGCGVRNNPSLVIGDSTYVCIVISGECAASRARQTTRPLSRASRLSLLRRGVLDTHDPLIPPAPAGRTVDAGFTDWSGADGASYKRVAFKSELDHFTRLEIDGAWSSSSTDDDALMQLMNSSSLTIHVESEVRRPRRGCRDSASARDRPFSPPAAMCSRTRGAQGAVSYQKLFRANGRTFPVFSAVVAVDEGKVTKITWDDGCLFCENDSEYCQYNT